MNRFFRFLLSMFKVGCIGFGGGSALIPVIEQEVVEKQKLDTKKNYDKDVLVANLTPGALPIEIAASLGKRSFGGKGLILGALMMALPGTLGAILLFTALSTSQPTVLNILEILSVGVSAFIIYLLVHYIIQVLKTCKAESNPRFYKALLIITAVFILVSGKNFYSLLHLSGSPVFAVSTIHVLLVSFFFVLCTKSNYTLKTVIPTLILCGLYLLSHGKSQIIENPYMIHAIEWIMILYTVMDILRGILKSHKHFDPDWRAVISDTRICLLFLILMTAPMFLLYHSGLAFMGKGLLSALMSFGGGDAYLTIAHGLFVDSGMITEETYYGAIVPVVNILPGSILCKTLSGVGYFLGLEVSGSILGGVIFALAGLAGSIAASCAAFFVIYHLYDSVSSLTVVRTISRWIRPLIAGLLCNIILSLCNQNRLVAEERGIPFPLVLCVIAGLAALDYIWSRKKGAKTIWMLLVNVLVGGMIFFIF